MQRETRVLVLSVRTILFLPATTLVARFSTHSGGLDAYSYLHNGKTGDYHSQNNTEIGFTVFAVLLRI
jgi:hypothetical protein